MLLERIGNRSSGRVWYRDPDTGIAIAIELSEGKPIACRGTDERGNIVEGCECFDLATRFLEIDRSVVEFEGLDHRQVELDLREFPSSHASDVDIERFTSILRGATRREVMEKRRVSEELRIEELDVSTTFRILECARLRETLSVVDGSRIVEVLRRGLEEGRKLYLSLVDEDGTGIRIVLEPSEKVVKVFGIEVRSFVDLLENIASRRFRRATVFELQ